MKMNRTVVYTPDSPLKNPGKLVVQMIKDLRSSWFLAWCLMRRDITSQYRQTILGYLWALLPPLMTSAIFIFLNQAQIIQIKTTDIPYPVFVITGTVFWQLFVDSLNAPLKEISTNRAMLTKIDFPKEALIISGIGQVMFSFLIKLAFLFLILIAFKIPLGFMNILLVLPIIGLVGLGTLIGIFLVPLGVLYRDIQQGISLIIQPLMLLTPVIYPAPPVGILSKIMEYNPISPLILTARSLIVDKTPENIMPFVLVFVISYFMMAIGWVTYRVAIPILVERMDA